MHRWRQLSTTSQMFVGILVPLLVLGFAIQAVGLEVACVPWLEAKVDPKDQLSHPTWSGKEVTIKGTIRHAGDVAYEWDFGDGSAKVAGNVTASADYPVPVEARHAYTGPDGRLFVARLTATVGEEISFAEYRLIIQCQAPPTLAAEVNVAIDEGLWALYKSATRSTTADGAPQAYWAGSYGVGHTGIAVQAFEKNMHYPLGNPKVDPYVELVQRGLNYLLTKTYKLNLTVAQGDMGGEDPGNASNGFGLVCTDVQDHEMYEIGIAMMAFVTSNAPGLEAATGGDGVKGRKYQYILQDMSDFCAYAQNDNGGWRYSRNYGSSDNSVTQWPIIGLHPAEADWGSKIADFVKPNLWTWLKDSQSAGGYGYTTRNDGGNVARTAGSGITGMVLACGGDPSKGPCPEVAVDPAVFLAAVKFVGDNWGSGNIGNLYAMYAVKKAFGGEFLDDVAYRVIPGGHDWFTEYANYLVDQQRADGNWNVDGYYSPTINFSTGLAILILTPGVIDRPPTAFAKCNGADSTHVDKGQNVFFDASMTELGNYPICKYEWDFAGDGNFVESAGPTIEHAYDKYLNEIDPTKDPYNDPYVVTLRVTDCRDKTTTKPAQVDTDTCEVFVHPPPHPPIAVFEFQPASPCTGQEVTLDGRGSYDPNPTDEIVEWLWDLDSDEVYGEAGETGSVLQRAWPSTGTYPVSLKVVVEDATTHDPATRETSAPVFKNIYISENPAPMAILTCPEIDPAGCPAAPTDRIIEIGIGQEIHLDGSCSSDVSCLGAGGIAAYAWDLDGDGKFGDEDDPPEPTAATIPYSKAEYGTFVVCLEVRDVDGKEATTCRSVSVSCTPPVCVIEADGKACLENVVCATVRPDQPVHLDGSKSFAPDAGTQITGWEWDLDGVGVYDDALGPTCQVDWSDENIHEVGLRVTLDCGESQPGSRFRTCTKRTLIEVKRGIDCSNAIASVTTGWPPNHKFVLIEVEGIVVAEGEPKITIEKVTQDETVKDTGQGSGSTCPDAVLVDLDGDGNPEAAGVRVERNGTGNGRVYAIHFQATDVNGDVCDPPAEPVTFCVPHDQSGDLCLDNGQVFDSTAGCPKKGGGGSEGTGVYSMAEFEALAPEPLFLRGDVDWSDALDITDAIVILGVLFSGQGSLSCRQAADANDDGEVDVSDPIAMLSHLYAGRSLPPPVGAVGPDPTPDALTCE